MIGQGVDSFAGQGSFVGGAQPRRDVADPPIRPRDRLCARGVGVSGDQVNAYPVIDRHLGGASTVLIVGGRGVGANAAEAVGVHLVGN